MAVKEPQEEFRVEKSTPNTLSDLSNKMYSSEKPVCILAVTSASKIFCLETGPRQPGYRCNVTSLGKQIPLCIPIFLNDKQSFMQGKMGQGR